MHRTLVAAEQDQRVLLHFVRWEAFERVLEGKGDASGTRLAFLDGELEIMSPSWSHEWIKKTLARLVEAYAEEMDMELTGAGSWTLRNRIRSAGLEPDECYVLGPAENFPPELALEVVWTSGGIDKLEIYRRLGVREVWHWQEGVLSVHVLRGKAYSRSERSRLFPDLDLGEIRSALASRSQSKAVREFRKGLRTRRGPQG